VPPEVELVLLPPSTSASELLDYHKNRLRCCRSSAIAFTPEGLKTDTLANAQSIFDHMVKIGLFVPISEEDVDRLKNESM
jgi:hypothetical protein